MVVSGRLPPIVAGPAVRGALRAGPKTTAPAALVLPASSPWPSPCRVPSPGPQAAGSREAAIDMLIET